MNQCRCEICTNKNDCDEYESQAVRDVSVRCGLACHSDFQAERKTSVEVMGEIEQARQAEREKVLDKLDGVTKLEDFLEWVADRLEFVYHDSPRVDFILSLRKRAKAARELRQEGKDGE